ncbi:MAG: hypothetical protein HC904_04620 [Blastochloris sp.]|nr:hypothetical protein [Blastochloris sp.]
MERKRGMSSTKEIHPRLKHYPWHSDYVKMASEFRPYVMFAHEANYRSTSVNTDDFGLREQFDFKGEVVNWRNLGREPHTILLGGSSVFGVDASSDVQTLSAHLQKHQKSVLNWGVRGASNQQELLHFLFLKRFVPRIQHVVLLTGVNLCSLASLKNIVMYPDYGAIFSQQVHFSKLLEDYRRKSRDPSFELRRFLVDQVAPMLEKNRLLGSAVHFFLNPRRVAQPRPLMDFQYKIDLQLELLENDLDTWRCLSKEMGFKLHFVLQPAIRWTLKPLTFVEKQCFEADLKIHPSTLDYANSKFYEWYCRRLGGLCARRGIDFHDSNQWLNVPELSDKAIFTDVCHLTDEGNKEIAVQMQKRLKWNQDA